MAADSRRSGDEIHPWLLNGDLRPEPGIRRYVRWGSKPVKTALPDIGASYRQQVHLFRLCRTPRLPSDSQTLEGGMPAMRIFRLSGGRASLMSPAG